MFATVVESALLALSPATDDCSVPTCDATAADCEACTVLTDPSMLLVAAIAAERVASTDFTLTDRMPICEAVDVLTEAMLASVYELAEASTACVAL